jgi:hypothetical protein
MPPPISSIEKHRRSNRVMCRMKSISALKIIENASGIRENAVEYSMPVQGVEGPRHSERHYRQIGDFLKVSQVLG